MIRTTLGLLMLMTAAGCFVVREEHLQAERIDDHLQFRFDEFRGWTKIEPEKRRLREAVASYLRDNPEVDSHIKKHLQNLEIAIGMTKEQVRLLWGEPNDLDTQQSLDHKMEWWFYDRIPMTLFEGKTWFYALGFDNGRLSQIIQQITNQPL